MFGRDEKSGINTIGVEVTYSHGKDNKFVAWERGGQNAEQSNPDITLTGETDSDMDTTNTAEQNAPQTSQTADTSVPKATGKDQETLTAGEIEEQTLQHTLNILNLRNRFSISYKVLHELRMAGFPVPAKAVIKEQSDRLSRCVDIYQVLSFIFSL